MRSILFALTVFACAHCSLSAATRTKSIDHLATHHQIGVIEIADEGNPMKMNAFCLDLKGRIVAACGTGPGEIRIVNDEGEILQSWSIDVKPEAVNVAEDGTILVGGEGKLFRFDTDGKQLHAADSPHAEKLRSSREQLRKSAIEYLNRNSPRSRVASYQSRIASYEKILKQLEERASKGEMNESEERLLKILPQMMERYEAQAAAFKADEEKKDAEKEDDEPEDKGPSETAIQSHIDSLVRSKMRISSISSGGDHVFVATRGIEGYGYDVWKMDSQFASGEVIVAGLRGCCGQMDVQCCKQGLFVAENSRDRVVHFDTDGKQITYWGKSDRNGIDGFTSCCNPMNVCFDSSGDVYTAEASSGRIKRFNTKGDLVAVIGDVDLVPGCKNVSIAVSPVSDNIYMLDLTRNHIKRMQPKPEKTTDSPEEEKPADREEEKTVNAKAKPDQAEVSITITAAASGD